MTDINKQIEEEAEKCLEVMCPLKQQSLTMEGKYYWWNHFKDGFINGANYALHSTRWRKVSEELPEAGCEVLCKFKFGSIDLVYGYQVAKLDKHGKFSGELDFAKVVEWKPID